MRLTDQFEQTVQRHPNRIAVRDGQQQATFGELRARALLMATFIEEKLYGAINEPVAFLLPESVAAIEAIFGTLYSGNFYVPLLPGYSDMLLGKVVEFIHPRLIITNLKLSGRLIRIGIPLERMLIIETLTTVDLQRGLEKMGHTRVIDTDPIYVMHTSGSTGQPKGVTIRHRGLEDFVEWVGATFEMGPDDIMLSCNSFGFDNSVLEIFSMACFGSRLIISRGYFSGEDEGQQQSPPDVRTIADRMMQLCARENANFLFWIPSQLMRMADHDALERHPQPQLHKVLFCGEVMPNRHLNYWRRHVPQARFANLYGPTEITDACACYLVDRDFADDEPLPIGKACRNTRILLLHESGRPAVVGEQGEILVQGSCLAAGYYNQPELTAAAFIQTPLHNRYPDVCYRTGDIGEWNASGELLFHGRKDAQIKIMGLRIELSEVEHVANQMQGIHISCAVHLPELNKLALFYEAGADIPARDVANFLLHRLIAIPTDYVLVEHLPRLQNGKLDRPAIARIAKEKWPDA